MQNMVRQCLALSILLLKDGDFSKYSGSIGGNMGDYFISSDKVYYSNSSLPLFPQVNNMGWDNITDLKSEY